MTRWERNTELLKLYEKKDNGRYRYIGRWLTLDYGQSVKPYLRLFWLQLLLMLAINVAMLVTPAGPMISYRVESFNYVMLLFGVEFLCSVACIYYTWKVLGAKLWLPEHDSKYPDWHSAFSFITALAALGLLIAQLIYLLSAGHPDDRAWDILLAVLALLNAAVNGLSWYFQRGMKWTMLPNDAKK